MERPAWAFTQTAIIFRFYEAAGKRVFILEGLDHHYDLLPLLKPSHHCLISIPCFTTAWNFSFALSCLQSQNPNFPPANITFLANTREQEKQAKACGFGSIFFNQNALLDEQVYWLRRDGERNYDLVLNTRPERNFKRPYLACEVERLAIIQGYNFRKSDWMDLGELSPCYLNSERLSVEQVVAIYNQSQVGGIFSEKEGACYSSSEYLLCGLPVVSTPSQGGRDVWYNRWNSIICEPNEQAVREAVAQAKRNLGDGVFNRHRIRAMHIAMQHQMRSVFCHHIAELCSLSESQSLRLLQRHLASTNKLQHKVAMADVAAYLEGADVPGAR